MTNCRTHSPVAYPQTRLYGIRNANGDNEALALLVLFFLKVATSSCPCSDAWPAFVLHVPRLFLHTFLYLRSCSTTAVSFVFPSSNHCEILLLFLGVCSKSGLPLRTRGCFLCAPVTASLSVPPRSARRPAPAWVWGVPRRPLLLGPCCYPGFWGSVRVTCVLGSSAH